MKTGVLCAMPEEFKLFVDKLYNKRVLDNGILCVTTEAYGKDTLMVKLCGIGKVNAALSAKELLDLGCDGIISIGVAGGIGDEISVGDIVIGNSYCYHDVWCGEPNKIGQIQGLPAVFPSSFGNFMFKLHNSKIKLGCIATGDRFIQTHEEACSIKNTMPKSYNILAVDMESAAIAQVCYLSKTPFTSIRIISDCPLKPDQKKQYESFWENEAKESFNILIDIIK